MRICKVEGCNNKILAKGYCQRHYQQIYKYGQVLKRTTHDSNEIINCGNYYEVCIYKKHQEVAKTKIDKEDLDKVKNYKWCLNNKGYIINGKNSLFLHLLIMGRKEGYEVDHKFGNKLDNRKQNLRFVTHSQNLMNQKNAKGYYWHKRDKRWRACIVINHKDIYLGNFINKDDAIIARYKAEKKYFGEFAYQYNND